MPEFDFGSLLPEEKAKKPPVKITPQNHPESSPKISHNSSFETLVPSVSPSPTLTLDTIRGLYFLSTGIGDKSRSKAVLETELKTTLLDPHHFGKFLSNLATYLQGV